MSKKYSTFAPDFALMSEHDHYIVDLKHLEIGVHRFDIQLDEEFFSSLEKTEILGGRVAASATLDLREDYYTLTIAVRGTVKVVCDRCLDPMELSVEDEQAIESDELAEEQTAMSSEQKLDLRWLAYEIVSTNIPLVHCHPTGGCNPQMDLLLQTHLCDEPDDPEI